MISNALTRKVHPDCRAFVTVVEELLARRQHEYLTGARSVPSWQVDEWGPRKWHRTELEDMVYSSYKRMRQGAITRPPRRQVVMDIADYLNCSLRERNHLLLAAHLQPIEAYVTGAELQMLVRLSAEAALHLPMPWMIINRDWHVEYANEHLLALYAVRLDQLAAIPPERFNVLHLLFDPALPFYANITIDRMAWEQMALLTVLGFKQANRFCQNEDWYGEVVNRLMVLPDFARIWREADLEQQSKTLPVGVTFATTLPGLPHSVCLAQLRPLLISVGYTN